MASKDGRGRASGVVATSTRRSLVHTTNPDHLVSSTPSLTDVPRLQVVPRYRGMMGVGGRDLTDQLAIAS